MNKAIVISITSASGGSGKTTGALALSKQLAQCQRVLLMNTDTLQVVPSLASIGDLAYYKYITQSDISAERIQPFLCQHADGYDYVPLCYRSLPSLGIDQCVFLPILEALQNSSLYDVIIVDTDHVMNTFKSQLLAVSHHVLFTYRRQDRFETEKYKRLVDQLILKCQVHRLPVSNNGVSYDKAIEQLGQQPAFLHIHQRILEDVIHSSDL